MGTSVLNELRILTSTRFDSRSILSVVLAGDDRLPHKLRREDLLPLASRIRTCLRLEPATDELCACLMHRMKVAGNAAAHALYNIIDRRHGRASTAITSNIELSEWGLSLGDAVITRAILDRIVMNAVRLRIDGHSYRQQVAEDRAKARADKRSKADKAKPALLRHDSILSSFGVSGNPGAIHVGVASMGPRLERRGERVAAAAWARVGVLVASMGPRLERRGEDEVK